MRKWPTRRPTPAQRAYLEELRRKNAWLEALWWYCGWRDDGKGGYYRLARPKWATAAERKSLRKSQEHALKHPWPYGLPPGVLARYERSFVKYGHEEALDDAVRLLANYPAHELPPWMREGLAGRARADILGTRKKKKTGPHIDHMRDYIWFNMVQDRVDGGMRLVKAVSQTCLELGWHREHGGYPTDGSKRSSFYDPVNEKGLKAVYYRTKKWVRRARDGWAPLGNVYVPASASA